VDHYSRQGSLLTIMKQFFSKFGLPFINILLFVLTLYTTISRILMWNILELLINANVQRIINIFSNSPGQVLINYQLINVWICEFVIACSALLLIIRVRHLREGRFWLNLLPLILVLVISGLSLFWSVSEGVSLRRFQLFLAAALGGLYFSFEYKNSKLERWLEVFAIIMVVGSLIMTIKYPDYTIVEGYLIGRPKAWLGLFSWKMPMGIVMGFCSIAFLSRMANFKNESIVTRVYSLVFFILAVFLTIKSQSMTEVIALVGALAVFVLAFFYLQFGHFLKPIHWRILSGVAIILLIGLWLKMDLVLGVFGRNSTFTGRAALWTVLIPIIKARIYFGYGFGEAFWKNSQFYQVIWDALPGFRPVFAHNGYIETILSTGMVGFVFWLIFLIQTLIVSFMFFFRNRTLPAILYFSFVVYVLIANIANNHMGTYETLSWFLLVIAFAVPIRQMLEQKQLTK
jgi:exopolysaccharide production protein ExoQ